MINLSEKEIVNLLAKSGFVIEITDKARLNSDQVCGTIYFNRDRCVDERGVPLGGAIILSLRLLALNSDEDVSALIVSYLQNCVKDSEKFYISLAVELLFDELSRSNKTVNLCGNIFKFDTYFYKFKKLF